MEDILLLNNGMHSDNDPMQQPPNTYRDALNGNLISIGENRFSFESVKGTTLSFTLPTHLAGIGTNELPFQIIGWTSFLDYLIVLIGNDNTVGTSYTPGEIGKVTFNNAGTGTYVPLYYHQDLGFSKLRPIAHDAIVGKPENTNIRRVVWTDNNKPMRSLNVLDKRINTYYTSGQLTVGKKYMVLGTTTADNVVHNGITYGCGLIYSGGAQQNIFTAVSTAMTVAGSALVVDYISLDELTISADFTPGNINFKKRIIGGSLLPGTYQYAYQLENRNGSFTNWSVLSMPMYNPNAFDALTTETVRYAYFRGTDPTIATDRALVIGIDNLNTDVYIGIKIAFVYSSDIGVYTNPNIFLYTQLNASSMEFTHYGNEVGFGTVDLTTLTTVNQNLDLVKTITSTKNILFAGNIGLSTDPLINLSSAVVGKSIEYLLPSDTSANTAVAGTRENGFALFGHLATNTEAIGTVLAVTGQWYESTGTDIGTNNVSYNGTLYWVGAAAGAYFQAVSGATLITQNGAGRAIPVIRIQKYTGTYVYHRMVTDYMDFKGLTASHYVKSYWRDEKYRFGIFFYGKKGQQNFVTWLMDKTFPKVWHGPSAASAANRLEITKNDGTTTAAIGFEAQLNDYTLATTTTALRSLGIKFSEIDFNIVATAYGCALADLDDYISGFSIVRMERDGQIIHQGMLWPNVMSDGVPKPQICSTDNLGNEHVWSTGPNGRRQINSYMYYSPDQIVSYDNTIKDGDYLEVADKYDTTTNLSMGITANMGGMHSSFIGKWWNTNRTVTGTSYGVGETAPISPTVCFNIGAFQNATQINNVCMTDAFATRGQTSAAGLGAKGLYVTTTNDEITYPLGFGMSNGGVVGVGGSIITKPIVNWKRTNNNQYGGTSDIVKSTNKYINCGHYQVLDSAFMTYMTGTSGGKLAGVVNDIEVFGGDAFVAIFGYNRVMSNDNTSSTQQSNGFAIPVECNLNENWRGWLDGVAGGVNRNGAIARTFNSDRNYSLTNTNGIFGNLSFSHQLEATTNFKAFAGQEKQYYFVARPFNFVSNARDEQLIIRSLIKINGEPADNWKVFLTNNQIRVDSQYGPINNIRAKAAKLFYWQSKGVGHIPILERQMDSGLLGGAIQMGVGGIMERFDEVDYYYGNQHQMSLMENENSFTWFDLRRRSAMFMTISGQSVQISEIKGLSNHFYEFFKTLETLATATSIFNSDSPLDERGIVSYYDPRFKLGLMVFKVDSTLSGGTNLNFTIGFDGHLNKYVGFFDIGANHMIAHNGHLLLTHLSGKSILNSTAYAVGDEVGYLGINYVCILAYTSASPATNPLSDSTHWSSTMTANSVHVGWRGNIAQIFSRIRKFYLTVVLKSRDMTNIAVDNVEVAGNDTPFTEVYIENQSGTASDTGITRTTSAFVVVNASKNYKYFDGSWWFNLPMKNKITKIVDHYVELKMQVTYTLTQVAPIIKRISYVKYFFRKKL